MMPTEGRKNLTECPVCHKTITDEGYVFGTEFKQRCVACSCGAYVIVNADSPQILEEKLRELKSSSLKKVDGSTDIVAILDRSVENAWLSLEKESFRAIWWDEQEAIFPFYAHLENKVAEINKNLQKTMLYVVPQYAEKASGCVGKVGKCEPMYPKAKKKKPVGKSQKIDLAIVELNRDDLLLKQRHPSATYWHIGHKPLVLLKFKSLTGGELLGAMETDLQKMGRFCKRYESIKRVYSCLFTGTPPTEKEIRTRVKKSGLTGLARVCIGSPSGKFSVTSF